MNEYIKNVGRSFM